MENSSEQTLEWLKLLNFPSLPGLTHEQSIVVGYTWIVMAIIVVALIFVCINLKRIPRGFQGFLEMLCSFWENYTLDVIGPKGLPYFPLIMTIFLFILFSNYIGLVPGFQPPTANIGTNAACAIVVFLFYQYVGISKNGLKYLKKFLGPIPVMAPFMLVIEIISELARPVSLAVRLFANIFGGEMIIKLFFTFAAFLAGFLGIFMYFIPLPVIWMSWESIITCPIQAFVFSLLTLIYLMGAIHAEEH
jgi:F-type H+-transporting ATPase subunit a